MSQPRQHSRTGHYNFDLSSSKTKEVEIQLTASQSRLKSKHLSHQKASAEVKKNSLKPFDTRSNKLREDEVRIRKEGNNQNEKNDSSRSIASTTIYSSQQRADQKALMKKVLARKSASSSKSLVGARSTVSAYSSLRDQKAFLTKVLSEKTSAAAAVSSAKSSTSTSVTSDHIDDQKALLRKVLKKSLAKKKNQSKQRTEGKTELSGHILGLAETNSTTNASRSTVIGSKTVDEFVLDQTKTDNNAHDDLGKTDQSVIQQITLSSEPLPNERCRTSTGEQSEEIKFVHNARAILRSQAIDIRRKEDEASSTVGIRMELQISAKEKSRLRSSTIDIKKTNKPMIEVLSVRKGREGTPVVDRDAINETGSRHARKIDTSMQQDILSPPLGFALPASITSASCYDAEGNDNEGYAEFLRVLQKEVSSDHTELWRSFQGLFYGPDNVPAPLAEKPKRVRFDNKTKETLTKMNLHLKDATTVECVPETQLVNDKKVSKEVRRKSNERKLTMSESFPSEAQKSFTARERLEIARKQNVKQQNSTLQKSTKTASVNQRNTIHSRDYSNTESSTDNMAPEWPQPEEKERTQLHFKESGINHRLYEKQKSWLAVQREKKLLARNNKGDVTNENDTLPPWPEASEEESISPGCTLRFVDKTHQAQQLMSGHSNRTPWLDIRRQKQEQPTKMSTKDVNDPTDKLRSLLELQDKPTHTPTSGQLSTSFHSGSVLPAKRNDPAPRLMPWMVALQERKARLAEKARSLVDESSDDSEDGNRRDQDPTGAYVVDSFSRSSAPEGQIELQRNLMDDVSDDEENASTPTSSISPGSLSGRKRRIDEESQKEYDVPAAGDAQWVGMKIKSAPCPLHQEKKQDVPWAELKLRPVGVSTFQVPESKESSPALPFRPMLKRVTLAPSKSFEDSEPKDALPTVAFRQILEKVPISSSKSFEAPELKDNSATISFRQNLKQGPSEVTKNRKSSFPADDRVFRHSLRSSKSTEKPILSEDYALQVGDKIDLRNLPAHLFEKSENAFVMQLEWLPGTPNSDKELVVVGRKILVTVRSQEESELLRVTWRLSRREIDSLTLDMAHNRATMSLTSDGTKSMSFANAQDCLSFANAFYMTKRLQSEQTPEIPKPMNGRSKKGEQSTPSLNDEEKKLLDTYRQIRQTKTPDEAMKQVVGDSVPGSTKVSLTEEEQEAILKFQTMRVSEEAVRHKMTTKQCSSKVIPAVFSLIEAGGEEKNPNNRMVPSDGIRHQITEQCSPKIVDTLLGSTGTNEAKTLLKQEVSLLSEDEEKTADKFKKMLKMRVPVEAVRHKMILEKCPSMIVDVVLGDKSSPISQLSSQSPCKDDEKIESMYHKMLKTQIPTQAVYRKISKDKVNPKIVAAVLNINQLKSSGIAKPLLATKLSEEEGKVAIRFRKMLQMRVPIEAVRHKMLTEKIDIKVVVAVLGPDIKDGASPEKSIEASLSAENEKIVTRYRKMLKMMIPRDAVRHKMKQERVDQAVINAVLGNESKILTGEKKPNSLSEDEEKVASPYRKMLKMNVPKDAIKNKMLREGVSSKIISEVAGGGKTEIVTPKPISRTGSKLVSLHWTPLLSDEQLQNSIWNTNKKRKVNAEESDVSKLCELFQKKTSKILGKGASSDGGAVNGNGDNMAKLIDLSRSNNVAISLKAFKEFSFKVLAEIIANVDPKQLIQGERCQFIRDLLPNVNETKMVKGYKGSDVRLVAAELWFREICNVPRVSTKVQVMQTMDTFREHAIDLSSRFELLGTVCNQVIHSEKLQDVLELVLQVGNIMNEGTRTGGAIGFKFDSLLKLTQTKSSDGKTTVLDYLAMVFMAKNKRETLNLLTEFPDVLRAGRMIITDMKGDVQQLRSGLDICKRELANMKGGASERPASGSTGKRLERDNLKNSRPALLSAIKALGASDDDNVSFPDDSRNVHLSSIKATNQDEQAQTKTSAQRDRLLGAIKKRKDQKEKENDIKKGIQDKPSIGGILSAITSCGQLNDIYDSEAGDLASNEVSAAKEKLKKNAVKRKSEISNPSGTHCSGIFRLEKFVDKAGPDLLCLEKKRDEATKACRDLAMYCGEGGGERAAITLLSILSEFATNLSNGLKKYDAKEATRKRKEAAQKKKDSLEPKLKAKKHKLSALIKEETPEGSLLISLPVNSKEGNILSERNSGEKDQSLDSLEHAENMQVKTKSGSESPATESPMKKGPSLILMVNNMLKVSSEEAKQDFICGVVHEKTSDFRLKRIYEREKGSIGASSADQSGIPEEELFDMKESTIESDLALPSFANNNTTQSLVAKITARVET